MTVVSILNDAWQTIKENPQQFIENIEAGMENYYGTSVHSYPVGNYSNPMEVHSSFHANINKVIFVGGNHMENLAELGRNKSDDFYLAYKLRSVRTAEMIAKETTEQIIEQLANTIAANIKASGEDANAAFVYVDRSETYKLLSKEEQAMVMRKIASKIK